MSCTAAGSSAKVGLIEEITYGETPATPELTAQRFASVSLGTNKAELLDPSIVGGRQYGYTVTGNEDVSGDLAAPLAYDNFDDLLASCFHSEWDTNVLKVGETQKSFTMEVAQEDVSIYNSYKGVMVNSMSLSVPIDALVEATYGLVAQSETVGVISIDTDGDYSPQMSTEPFFHKNGTLSEGGVQSGIVQSIDITFTNNLEGFVAFGNTQAKCQVSGKVDVTGSLTVAYNDATMIDKFLNDTPSDLVFTLTDGTNTMTFDLPNIKYTGGQAPVDGEGPRLLSMEFRGLYDATEETTMSITRS